MWLNFHRLIFNKVSSKAIIHKSVWCIEKNEPVEEKAAFEVYTLQLHCSYYTSLTHSSEFFMCCLALAISAISELLDDTSETFVCSVHSTFLKSASDESAGEKREKHES